MSTPVQKLQTYGRRLPLLLILLTLPWLWAALIVPWWVSLVGLIILPAAAAMIVVAVFPSPSPSASRRASDATRLSDAQVEKMREASSGLHKLLGRWSTVSRNTGASLESAQQQVDEVILQSEAAVLDITNGFLGVTRKTRTQMEYALSLLQQTKIAGEHTAHEDLSLPEYIRASEAMLNSLTAHLLHFSEASLELVQRQERVREQTRRIDDLLDQMTSLAGQVGRVALNTSVMVQGGRRENFIEMADKVRGLSQAANDLSRDVRQSLGDIKEEMSEAYTALNNMAQEARTTAQRTLAEVEPLGRAMLDKNRQVANILDRINIVGHEIQQDINQIIVAMQFQDIIQQKLERLKAPVLTQVLDVLRSLSDETRFLNQRINPKLVDASGMTKTGSFRVVKNGAVTTVSTPEEQLAAPEPKRPGEASDKIELF